MHSVSTLIFLHFCICECDQTGSSALTASEKVKEAKKCMERISREVCIFSLNFLSLYISIHVHGCRPVLHVYTIYRWHTWNL